MGLVIANCHFRRQIGFKLFNKLRFKLLQIGDKFLITI